MVASDAEARRVVEAARRAGDPVPPLGLLGGDLCRTLGGRGDRARLDGPDAAVLPVDLGSVLLDGRQHWFVAHLVARRSWWRGRIVAAMNAEFLGDWDVAPRAHPDDGVLDLFDVAASMSLTDRLAARRRLPAGGHLPHPAIAASRRSGGPVRARPADPGVARRRADGGGPAPVDPGRARRAHLCVVIGERRPATRSLARCAPGSWTSRPAATARARSTTLRWGRTTSGSAPWRRPSTTWTCG